MYQIRMNTPASLFSVSVDARVFGNTHRPAPTPPAELCDRIFQDWPIYLTSALASLLPPRDSISLALLWHCGYPPARPVVSLLQPHSSVCPREDVARDRLSKPLFSKTQECHTIVVFVCCNCSGWHTRPPKPLAVFFVLGWWGRGRRSSARNDFSNSAGLWGDGRCFPDIALLACAASMQRAEGPPHEWKAVPSPIPSPHVVEYRSNSFKP